MTLPAPRHRGGTARTVNITHSRSRDPMFDGAIRVTTGEVLEHDGFEFADIASDFPPAQVGESSRTELPTPPSGDRNQSLALRNQDELTRIGAFPVASVPPFLRRPGPPPTPQPSSQPVHPPTCARLDRSATCLRSFQAAFRDRHPATTGLASTRCGRPCRSHLPGSSKSYGKHHQWTLSYR